MRLLVYIYHFCSTGVSILGDTLVHRSTLFPSRYYFAMEKHYPLISWPKSEKQWLIQKSCYRLEMCARLLVKWRVLHLENMDSTFTSLEMAQMVGSWGFLHVSLVTRLARLLGQIWWSVRMENFSLVDQVETSRNTTKIYIKERLFSCCSLW